MKAKTKKVPLTPEHRALQRLVTAAEKACNAWDDALNNGGLDYRAVETAMDRLDDVLWRISDSD